MIQFSKTYMFSYLSKSYDIKKVLVSAAAGEYDIKDKETYETSFDSLVPTITREISLALKAKVLKEFESFKIKPIFIPEEERFPSSIPFIVKKTDGGFIVLINIAPHCLVRREADGKIWYKITYKKFYALLQSAYIYRNYVERPELFSKNEAFLQDVSNAYAQMMYYTLDKHYSVGGIYDNIDKTLAITAYYFASACMDAVDAKAVASSIPQITDKDGMREFVKILPEQQSMTSFEKYVSVINEYVTSLQEVTVDNIIGNYARDWNSATLVGLEFLPYFLHIVGSAYIGAEITKDIIVVRLLRLLGPQIFKTLAIML